MYSVHFYTDERGDALVRSFIGHTRIRLGIKYGSLGSVQPMAIYAFFIFSSLRRILYCFMRLKRRLRNYQIGKLSRPRETCMIFWIDTDKVRLAYK